MMEEPDDGLRMAREIRKPGHSPDHHAHQRQRRHGPATSTRTKRWSRSTSSSPSRSTRRRWSPRSRGCSRSERGARCSITEREQLRNEVIALVDKLGPGRSSLIPILQDVKGATTASTATPCRSSPTCWTSTPSRSTASPRSTRSSTRPPRASSSSASAARSRASCGGKDAVARQLENELGIGFGETTADGLFTLEWANCMGMCDQGPALLVNDRVYTAVTPETVRAIVDECRAALAGHAAERRRSTSYEHRDCRATPSPSPPSTATPASRPRWPCRAPTSSTPSRASGLKGRGGAGFPTGMKWNFAAR